ncbi:hypothetical protein ASG52_07370 [Methylobacterium sp. Leaf456]|uniref:hypothetical protein n=1 Tax=Methylobacterium sp. Leaf456 TaxID=1736382 RepID=UPI0006F68CA5|nr:hypothetical protein [Methylobacterium sp. Leaf456]KQT49904.1 hypothetical protein ASG52_07370 [Methylobacterium sp. Leaf456]
MRFLLEGDDGAMIRGWVVPDDPTAISRVYVTVEGRRVAEVSAIHKDPTFIEYGWHSTGQCHFEVRDHHIPGLAGIERLEIYDVDTNVLIHRRLPQAGLAKPKAVLVNMHIRPETVIQTALFPHFKQSYFGIGRFPEEILLAMFDTDILLSCLMAGSIILPRYEGHFVQGEALTMLLLHDPYVEMASRLAWLRERADIANDPNQRWRLGHLAEAASFTLDYDYTDVKSLKRLFRMMPEPAYHLLYNPYTRQLSTTQPDDRIIPANSIIAVEVLARAGLVGHRDYFEAFMATVFDRLGITAPVPLPLPIANTTLELAERLRGLRFVREWVEFDMVLSDAVHASVSQNWRD